MRPEYLGRPEGLGGWLTSSGRAAPASALLASTGAVSVLPGMAAAGAWPAAVTRLTAWMALVTSSETASTAESMRSASAGSGAGPAAAS